MSNHIVTTLNKCHVIVQEEKSRIKQGYPRNKMVTGYLDLAERHFKRCGSNLDFDVRMMRMAIDNVTMNYFMGAYDE